MRFLIISAIFPPEPLVSARTSAQIAEGLTKEGHEVVIITSFPSRPSRLHYPNYSRKIYKIEISPDGYQIIRCFSFFSARSTIISRFAENLSFGVVAGMVSIMVKKPDAIYVNSWPLFSTGILYLISRLLGVPILMSIQDLYPESLITQGRIHNRGLFYRLFLWLDGVIARGAEKVIVISDHFANVYRELRKVEVDKIHVVPNWASIDEIHLDVQSERYRDQMGIPKNAFVLVYGGNIGVASGIDAMLEPFKELGSYNGIYLIIAGEGSRLAHCKEVAKKIPGNKLIVHTPWYVSETSLILRSADLLILPTRSGQSMSSIPSKLIYYMLAARPILALVHSDSETAKVITQAKCGWILHPDQSEAIMEKIIWIKDNSSGNLAKMGQSGREYAINHYSKESCLPKLITLLEESGKSNHRYTE